MKVVLYFFCNQSTVTLSYIKVFLLLSVYFDESQESDHRSLKTNKYYICSNNQLNQKNKMY